MLTSWRQILNDNSEQGSFTRDQSAFITYLVLGWSASRQHFYDLNATLASVCPALTGTF